MAKDKSTDPLVRKNISLRRSVITIGDGLVVAMHKSSFSQLLAELVLDAHKRQSAGEAANPEKNLKEMLELLAENRALKTRIRELEGGKPMQESTKKPSGRFM
jgi:hypothetical protein